jgi:hypothetical protein
VFTATASNWSTFGLTLTLGDDGKLHLYQTDTAINVVPPHNPANVTGVSITGRDNTDILINNYSGAYNTLLINHVTFKINQNNAISAATAVTIDGGVLDLNGKTDAISSLLLKSGSVINGTLVASSYTIESGTILAAITGSGALTKNTTGQAGVTAINNANTTVNGGTLTADSIITGTLTIGAGTTITIAAIAGGPSSTLAIKDTLTQLPVAVVDDSLADTTTDQTSAASQVSTSTSVGNAAITAQVISVSEVLPAPTATPIETSPIAQIAASGNLAVISADSISYAIAETIAMPEINADKALLEQVISDSSTLRQNDSAIKYTPQKEPIYSRHDFTLPQQIIESRLENSLSTGFGNTTGTPILESLGDKLPSRVNKIEKHVTTSAISSRQAHLAVLQTNIHNSRWVDTDAEADFDIAQHVRAGKHAKQLEKAVDEVFAEEEDVIPAVL